MKEHDAGCIKHKDLYRGCSCEAEPYNAGFEAGWNAALEAAAKRLEKPITRYGPPQAVLALKRPTPEVKP